MLNRESGRHHSSRNSVSVNMWVSNFHKIQEEIRTGMVVAEKERRRLPQRFHRSLSQGPRGSHVEGRLSRSRSSSQLRATSIDRDYLHRDGLLSYTRTFRPDPSVTE